MTVRRRLLGCATTFLAALALVSSAQAQPRPTPTRIDPNDPSTEDVKRRLESLFNRGRGGAGEAEPLPPGVNPEQALRLAELAKRWGITRGRDGKLPPEQVEQLQKDPRFKGMQQDAGPPPGLNPGDGPRPTPRGEGKLDPVEFGKGDSAEKGFTQKLPAQNVPQPRPVPPPPLKNDDRPPPPPTPPEAGARPQDLGDPAMPWNKPDTPQDKARQAAAAMWEKGIGPLDETPAVKKALFDIVDGAGDLKDPDGNGLWDSLSKDFSDGKGFGDLFKNFDGVDGGGDWDLGGGADWSFPKMNWNFNWGNSRPPDIGTAGPARESWFSRWRKSSSSSSSSSSSGSSWFSGWKAPRWNIGIPALNGTWWPVLFLILALVGGVFLWRFLAKYRRPDANTIDPYALSPWPVDPHHLRTRTDVVAAFEHLSVLLCGEVAKTWTHTTIAAALSEMAMAEPERAMMLARLYELARYTPIDEPLTTAELAEARRLVCRLAGFSDD
ncbi:MAG: hypothetical protein U0804_26755 [Gemmataceae bacterium]